MNHFIFLEFDRDLNTAVTGSYDFTLVLISVLMAVLSTYTAFLVSERLRATKNRLHYLSWLISGGLTLGGGVWAMHFIGMLAYELPVGVNYDVAITIISVVPAVLASLVVLRTTTSNKLSLGRLIKLSVLMGGGIGAMHYVGMAAMYIDGFMRYDPILFFLSIVVAVVLAGLSIKLKLWAEEDITTDVIFSGKLLIASIIMGSAIAGMHYTGMSAMHIFLEASSTVQENIWSAETLTKVIIAIALLTIMLMIIAIEVSRRFELFQEIKDSENRQRAILDNMLGAVISIDEFGIIQTVNKAVENIFGYMPDEIIGQNVKVLVPEPTASQHDQYLKKYREGGEAKIIGIGRETEGVRKDGSHFSLALAISEVEQKGQRMFIGIARDITTRVKAEFELEKYRDQLEKLVEERTITMKSALDEAERANATKSEFLSHMSHELRTPLNAIIGFSQMLELDEKILNETQNGNVKEILDAGIHLLSLINDVLDLAKIESGKLEVSIEKVNIDEVLLSSLTLIQTHAAERQIEIIDNLSDKGYSVEADFTRLKQVLLNLLSNAVKYNRESGKITISSKIADNQRIRISVTDTGEGLTDTEITKLFTPFERIDEFTNVEGTGIGLVITKHLVELMGGAIGVSSCKGKGSTFWIELVNNTLPSEKTKINKKNADDPFHREKNLGAEYTVLYIEDNPANLRLVTQLLNQQANIKLYSAEEPLYGIKLALEHTPDLVLLDINLPNIDGYEVFKRLRNNEMTKNIPVIAISANAMQKDIERGIAAGFDKYITKPINVQELLQAVISKLVENNK